MAFAVVGSPGVNTSVLAASIVDLTLINICRQRREHRQTEGDRWEINERNLPKFLHYGRGGVETKKPIRAADSELREVLNAGSRIKDVMDEKEKCSIRALQIKQIPHVVTTTEHLKPNLNSFTSRVLWEEPIHGNPD